MNHTKKQGFTIVELLVVIVILGILAAITVVAYKGIQERAALSNNVSIARSFISAFKLLQQTETLPENALCLGDSAVYGGDSGTCNVVGSPGVVDTAFNSKLANNGASALSRMHSKWNSGNFYYHGNWFGDYRVFIYYVGPDQDCGLANVLSTPYDEMTLSGAAYTARSTTATSCFIAIEKK